ncbi:MAG: SPASM domain-containing protein [Elusimicrobia bacterium]|nr:SPASM domain-containing protein [Elusimicrobiota bacterium]
MLKASNYNFLEKTDDGYLLAYNSKTGAFAAINGNLKDRVLKIMENPLIVEDKNIIEELFKGGFIIDDTVDEFAEIKKMYEEYKKDTKKSILTLLASETCNFNCPYCFIYERRGFNMKPWVYSAILKFIEKNMEENSQLKINWFGGEPTLAHKNIVNFMHRLNALSNQNKFKVIYSMVTNGYLLNKDRFSEYVELGLNMFQITLDGNKESHDKTRTLRNGNGTFETIWKNLEQIKETNKCFDMAIRVNFLKGMETEVELLAGKFAEVFGKDDRFNIYFRPVYDFKTTRDEICSIKEDIYSLKEGLYAQMKYNLLAANLTGKIKTHTLLSNPVPRPIPGWCDTEKKNFWVIGADGKLFKCDSYIGNQEQAVGELSEDGNIKEYANVYNWGKNIYKESETQKCKDCNLLPICQGGCPRMRKEQKNTCYLSEEQLKFALIETHKFNLNLKEKSQIK